MASCDNFKHSFIDSQPNNLRSARAKQNSHNSIIPRVTSYTSYRKKKKIDI